MIDGLRKYPMKTQSKIMLATQAIAIKYIGDFESPMPLRIELTMLQAVINGIPIKHTTRYSLVPATASKGVLTKLTMVSVKHNKIMVRTTDTKKKTVTVLPIQYFHFSLS